MNEGEPREGEQGAFWTRDEVLDRAVQPGGDQEQQAAEEVPAQAAENGPKETSIDRLYARDRRRREHAEAVDSGQGEPRANETSPRLDSYWAVDAELALERARQLAADIAAAQRQVAHEQEMLPIRQANQARRAARLKARADAWRPVFPAADDLVRRHDDVTLGRLAAQLLKRAEDDALNAAIERGGRPSEVSEAEHISSQQDDDAEVAPPHDPLRGEESQLEEGPEG